MTDVNIQIESQGHHFFDNLLELFHATYLAKDLIHRILPSP